MPVLFVGHGSPTNALEDNEFSRGWRDMARTLPRPRAILCISAHWETSGTLVTATEEPRTIHDFGGFPRELYAARCPAPGSSWLAQETCRLVKTADVGLDHKWGLDHGCWVPLRWMFPEVDTTHRSGSVELGMRPAAGGARRPVRHRSLTRRDRPPAPQTAPFRWERRE